MHCLRSQNDEVTHIYCVIIIIIIIIIIINLCTTAVEPLCQENPQKK
jgi:hypothetical protein